MNRQISSTTPGGDEVQLEFDQLVLVDSGEDVFTLPLHIALCRAVFDLQRGVPFAIRLMEDDAPGKDGILITSDGDETDGDPDLVALVEDSVRHFSSTSLATTSGGANVKLLRGDEVQLNEDTHHATM